MEARTLKRESPAEPKPGTLRARADQAFIRAVAHLRDRQQPNGALAGEVIWNPMLVCQYVIVCHIVGREIPVERRARVRLSLERQVRPDGGWGMHPDSPSWLFHTTLAYVTLRLLGTPPGDPLAANALEWIRNHGGVVAIPTWGRIWLALLGLYPWHGAQPIMPELWLLPDASPLHPRRLYCHMRLIYLGLSFLYGNRTVAPSDEVLDAVRHELYPEGYDQTRFEHYRDQIAGTDLFESPGRSLRLAFKALRAVEAVAPERLRRRALARALEHILFELRSTGYVCLSPVNGLLFCLALHVTDPHHPELEQALDGMEYWFWEDDVDGLRVCGARSDIWDTSFVIQAMSEWPDAPGVSQLVRDATGWLPIAQIQEEILGGEAHYRAPAYGGWGFANENHPWPVSDCTAEALEALMRAESVGLSQHEGRLQLGRKLAAVEFVLLRQNDDGGFGSYESRRGSMILRAYNPAEIYGNCMLEYSYTECTASCIRGLAYARRELADQMPSELGHRVREAVERGASSLLDAQANSGAWSGFWGINYTYGTYFATSGLLAAGIGPSHPALVRACRWLVESQRADGGWGEAWEGMLDASDARIPETEASVAVQTAWAVLTLLQAAPHERDCIERGIAYLLARQDPGGGWPQERATGCFFNTAVLDYALYRDVFPTWALARYLALGAS